MKLYFLRHAEAEDGPVDAKRELTVKGRRDARRVGRFLNKIEVQFDLAFSSPLVRARQTAEIVIDACPLPRKTKIAFTNQLLNSADEEAFQRWIHDAGADRCVLLVGHEPSLSAHVRRLTGNPTPSALPLAKGAVARVDTEDTASGVLKLLISPRQVP